MWQEVKQCIICGNRDFDFLFRTKDRLVGIEGDFKIYKCKKCQLRFINPKPDYESLNKYYPKEYNPNLRRTDDWRDRLEAFIFKSLAFPGLKFVISRGVVIKKGGKLLDIGAGKGNYLRIANKLGMKCYGNDLYLAMDHIPQYDDIKIYNKKFEDLEFAGDYFDVITMNHVLEHVGDPRLVLKKVNNILKPDGVFILHVPNGVSLNAKIFKQFYLQIDSPRHLHLFNSSNLASLCKQTGFIVDKIEFRTPVTIQTIILSGAYLFENLFNKGRKSNRLRKKLDHVIIKALLMPWAAVLGLFKAGDGIELYLRKQ